MSGLYIITGGSAGLGAALVKFVCHNGDTAISISRTAPQFGKHLVCDLSNTESSASAVSEMFQDITKDKFDEYILINNAGTIQPIGTKYETAEIIANMSINLISHIAITKVFVDRLSTIMSRKLVINITSGAALKPHHGWSLYCAAKAGLEHFGRTLALEQKNVNAPVDVVNINPGIINTKMQEEIRNASCESFPEVDRFKAFYENNALSSPDKAAERIIASIHSGKKFAGQTVNLE